MARPITLAHSPDADDAFMFFALAKKKIDTRGFEFRQELNDIETLNRLAGDGVHQVTAISFAAYPYIHRRYALLDCGASVGDGYGPIVVSKRSLTRADLDEVTVAVPGEKTTSFLVLRLFSPGARCRVVPFDQVLQETAAGNTDAGLVIHEGQLTFSDMKLIRLVDLGEWWKLSTGLPLPLGGIAVRRDLGRDTTLKIREVLRDSFRYALEHRDEALDHAIQFARGLDRELTDRFIRMYANEHAVDIGMMGRKAVSTLLHYGHDAGLVPERVEPEFID